MKAAILQVEFDTPTNANVQVAPLHRTLRGRFDVRRMKNAGRLFDEWPEAIPGQILSYDFAEQSGEVIEPLYEDRYAAIRERIHAKGMKLAPEREAVAVDGPTAHFWLSELIKSNKCKVVAGELPSKAPAGTPRTRFHSQERVQPTDRLAAAIEKQTEMMAELLSKLAK